MAETPELWEVVIDLLAVMAIIGLWFLLLRVYPWWANLWLQWYIKYFQGLLNVSENPVLLVDQRGNIKGRNQSARSFFRQRCENQPLHIRDFLKASSWERMQGWFSMGDQQHKIQLQSGQFIACSVRVCPMLGRRYFLIKWMDKAIPSEKPR